MLPLAPGRFSTITCWPRRAASGSATTRALLSATPAGAKGTMMRTAFAGHSCAAALLRIRQRKPASATLMKVELRYAPLPFIGAIAVHYWFVVHDDAGGCHRWEVWQSANAGGRSVEHLHCELKPPHADVGG